MNNKTNIRSASFAKIISIFSLTALFTIPQAQANMIVLKDGESFSRFSPLEYSLMIASGIIFIVLICLLIVYLKKSKKKNEQSTPSQNEGKVTMPTERDCQSINNKSNASTIGMTDTDNSIPATPKSGPRIVISAHLNTGEVASANIYYSELLEACNQRVAIGRDSSLWLYLKDSSVSRMHAELTAKDGKFWLRDKHSGNGTRVEGTPLSQKRFVPLANDNTVFFGKIEARVTIV